MEVLSQPLIRTSQGVVPVPRKRHLNQASADCESRSIGARQFA